MRRKRRGAYFILPATRKKGPCRRPWPQQREKKRAMSAQATGALAALPRPPPLLQQERPARQHWGRPRRRRSARDLPEERGPPDRLSCASSHPAALGLPLLSAPADLGLGPDHCCGGAVGAIHQSLCLCCRRMSCLESARNPCLDQDAAADRGCSHRTTHIPRRSLRRLRRSRRPEAHKRLHKRAGASLAGWGGDTCQMHTQAALQASHAPRGIAPSSVGAWS